MISSTSSEWRGRGKEPREAPVVVEIKLPERIPVRATNAANEIAVVVVVTMGIMRWLDDMIRVFHITVRT